VCVENKSGPVPVLDVVRCLYIRSEHTRARAITKTKTTINALFFLYVRNVVLFTNTSRLPRYTSETKAAVVFLYVRKFSRTYARQSDITIRQKTDETVDSPPGVYRYYASGNNTSPISKNGREIRKSIRGGRFNKYPCLTTEGVPEASRRCRPSNDGKTNFRLIRPPYRTASAKN